MNTSKKQLRKVINKEQEKNESSRVQKTTRSNLDLEDVSSQKMDQNMPYGSISKLFLLF